MTNLELAQQQGNQAAPNLLAAAGAGELGGCGSLTSPKPGDIVGLMLLDGLGDLSEAQLKIIKEKLDFIRGTELEVILVYTNSRGYLYINDRVLTRCKSVLQSLVEQKIAAQAGYTPEIIAAVSQVQSGWTIIPAEGLATCLAALYFNTSIMRDGFLQRISVLEYFNHATYEDYFNPGVFIQTEGDVINVSTALSNLGYQPDNNIFSSEMPVKFTEPIITYGHSLAPNGIRFTVNVLDDEQSTNTLVDTLLSISPVQFDDIVYIPVYFETDPDTEVIKVVAGELQYPNTSLSPEVASILSSVVAPRLQAWLENFDYECLKKVIDTESAPVITDSLGHSYAIFTNTSDSGGAFQVIPAIAGPVVLETNYTVTIPCISCFCEELIIEP